MSMDVTISPAQLKASLAAEWDALVAETIEAVNTAPAGHVIDASEERVRVATAKFRTQVFQRAIQLRTQAAQAAFSPSGRCGAGGGVGEQRNAGHQPPDE